MDPADPADPVDPEVPIEPAPSYVDRPPTAPGVLAGVFWRAWALTIGGGFVVGAIANLGLMTSEPSASLGTTLPVGLLGLFTGVLLGWVAALILAGLASLWTVPYPGATATVRLTRWIATATVGSFVAFMTGSTFGGWTAVLSVVAATLLAWWSSPWTVRWYVERVDAWEASIT